MESLLDVYDQLKLGVGQEIVVDFIGRGNIWINNTYDFSVIQLARHIIFEAITRTAPGQLSILGYDDDLSGIFAPFASLSEGESKQLMLVTDKKEFEEHLNYIRQQIQDVQNVIQGRSDSLLEFRSSVKRPVEGYKLVVISLDMGMVEQNMRSILALLMRSGPAFGISFLVISTTLISIQTSSGKDIELSVEAIAPNITILDVSGNIVSTTDGKKANYSPSMVEFIIEKCKIFAKNMKSAQLPVVYFSELHDMQRMWTEKSIDGVRFSIGKYGVNDMEIVIGDEANQRHNVIITGAVGQGKSNLISVIIHSLCQQYSPRELQMYLLDFKEGVTFKPFSDIGQEEYLPHAKALGLESDVDFGIAVLKSLYREYERRMKMLKEHNLKSIRELRIEYPDIEIPRIVVIIDEFQMMFGDDMQTGQRVAGLLEKSIRLFRASGIHFILASQTLGGNMALTQHRDNIFSQIPIRIALKNSVSESIQTLSINNPAAAFLRPREAIVNLDYGEISQNKKTVIAFADETMLRPIRKIWWENARVNTVAPYVFESEKRITISKGINEIQMLRKKGNIPIALIGNQISIDGEYIELPLSNEPGRNIAIIGTPDSDCNQAMGIMQSIAISLALQNPQGNARFLFCDFDNRDLPYDEHFPIFSQIMESAGYFIECIAGNKFEETIKLLVDLETNEENIYVFGSALDKWKYGNDPYGQGSVLKAFVENGPSKSMHFIGWWIKSSSFSAQVAGYGNSDAFNSKIFLRLDERAVQSLTNPFVRWSSQNNRALISDSIEYEKEIVFIPYSPVIQDDISKLNF